MAVESLASWFGESFTLEALSREQSETEPLPELDSPAQRGKLDQALLNLWRIVSQTRSTLQQKTAKMSLKNK